MPKPPFQLKKGIPQFTRTKGASPPIKTGFRRIIGAAPADALNNRATDAALLALCAAFKDTSSETQATMALGIYEDGPENVILYALQKGSNKTKALTILAALKAQPAYTGYEIRALEEAEPAPGLHAEMMIMRELMIRDVLNAGDVTGSALSINLRIVCPEKPVCPDCGGYLRKHWIPHYPVDCGKASSNWVNPRTGACFRAKGKSDFLTVTFYDKHGKKAKGNPVDGFAGALGAISRVK